MDIWTTADASPQIKEQRGRLGNHCWGSRNYPCEMIHNNMIKYAPKRVAFGADAYAMRISFAVLDHTENLKNKYCHDRSTHWRNVVKSQYFSKWGKK